MKALWRIGSGVLLAVGVAAGLSVASQAASVTPARLTTVLADAKGGETIVLAAGDFGKITLPTRRYEPAIRIDAKDARFEQLTLRGVSGVAISGGTVIGTPEQVFGLIIDSAKDVRVESFRISGSRVGVTVTRSRNIAVVGNDFTGTRSDGINVAMSRNVLVEHNRCVDFHPVKAVYDADGTLLRDGDHPDCVQVWSASGADATSDITIRGNVATGFMQGIFVMNPKGGPETRPFERIVVRDNVLTLSAFNGIVLDNAHDSDVRGNVVNSVKGSVLQAYPYPPIKAWIRVTGTNNRVCGNVVGSDKRGEGTKRC